VTTKMVPSIYSLSSTVWPVQKTDCSRKMIMNYPKFNKSEALVVAALLDVFHCFNKLTHSII
jgi:hypothetical protein